MRRLLYALLLCPLLAYSQQMGMLTISTNIDFVHDVKNTAKDVNSFSPDMSSSYNKLRDLNLGGEISIGYQLFDKLNLGISNEWSNIKGANSIENYQTNFH
jgi:hypothetical protein